MRRLIVPLCTVWLIAATGCGTDPREQQISQVLSVMDETASHLSQIEANLKKVVDKGSFNKKDLKEAEDAADKLKDETGKQLLDIDRRIKLGTDKKPLTQEEQNALKERFYKRVEDKMGDLNAKFRKVNEYLVAAEKIDSQAIQGLKKKLKDAQGDYEAVAKRS